MAEMLRKPREEEIEKLREYLGDPILFSLVTYIIKNLNEGNYHKSCESLWFSLTRQMFKNYPAIKVWEQIEMALEEASDEHWFENKYPKEIFRQSKPLKIKKKIYKSNIRKTIDKNLKITEIAGMYGLKIKGKMALCPFHADSKPSLSFDDERNIFRCFGCNISGDLIKFIGLMEDGKKRGRKEGT